MLSLPSELMALAPILGGGPVLALLAGGAHLGGWRGLGLVVLGGILLYLTMTHQLFVPGGF